MADVTLENPILNSPFDAPTRHWQFGESGITGDVAEGRRVRCRPLESFGELRCCAEIVLTAHLDECEAGGVMAYPHGAGLGLRSGRCALHLPQIATQRRARRQAIWTATS